MKKQKKSDLALNWLKNKNRTLASNNNFFIFVSHLETIFSIFLVRLMWLLLMLMLPLLLSFLFYMIKNFVLK